MMLGSGIQILEAALEKAAEEGVSTPPFIPSLDIKVNKQEPVSTIDVAYVHRHFCAKVANLVL